MSAREILIGNAAGPSVRLTVGNRFDEDHFTGSARVESGGLSGEARGFVLEWSLRRFRDDIVRLYETLAGTIEFTTHYEEWLEVMLKGNGRGGIEVLGVLRPDCQISQRLIFEFEIDQTYLPPVIGSLDAILGRRGRRKSMK